MNKRTRRDQLRTNTDSEEESELNMFLREHFGKGSYENAYAFTPKFTDSRKKFPAKSPGINQDDKPRKTLRKSLIAQDAENVETKDDNRYLAPKNDKDRAHLFLPKKKLIRKLVSLVKPNAKKMHLGLWKYVISIKNGGNANTGERIKAYISKDAEIFTKNKAFEACRRDQQDKTLPYERFKIGRETSNISRLEYWGLPKGIVKGFHNNTKIRSLFAWQIDLLRQEGVYDDGRSIVYFAPTSGGKSLPAELIMLRNIFVPSKTRTGVSPYSINAEQKRCVYILPFVSIVNEKTEYLKRICQTSNLRIEAFCSQSENVWTPNVDIAVCTIEKANSLLNKVIEEGTYRNLDIFVFDELHMILDGHRGYQIEYILTKLKALEKLEQERMLEGLDWKGEPRSEDDQNLKSKTFQIIGMSATMGKSEKLSEWLDCDIFESDYRPVPLSEYYISDTKMYNKKHEEVFKFEPHSNFLTVLKTIVRTYFHFRKSVILFCNTKRSCEMLVLKLSKQIENTMTFESKADMKEIYKELEILKGIESLGSPSKRSQEILNARNDILRKLSMTSVGLCDTLKETVPQGMAYHHSGLTDEERNIIEQGYRDGHLLLLAATSTLSTGINLPAKAVIFNMPQIGRALLDKTHYKQMSGRAGRTGFDTFGESILICDKGKSQHLELTKDVLMKGDFSEITLQSTIDFYTLRRLILESIASTAVKSFREIGIFLSQLLKVQLLSQAPCKECEESYHSNKCVFENDENSAFLLDSTLNEEIACYKDKIIEESDKNPEDKKLDEEIIQEFYCINCIYDAVFKVLVHLRRQKFLALSEIRENGSVLPTSLGKACFASSITPEEGLEIFKDLFNARLGLQLSSDLHLCFLVTLCMSPLIEPKWDKYSNRLNHLIPDEEKLLEEIGIDQEQACGWAYFPPSQDYLKVGGSQIYLESKKYCQVREERKFSQTDEPGPNKLDEVHVLRRYVRFFNALIIQDILRETPINVIASTYSINRGIVQQIQLAAVNASGILSCFCERLHWADLTVLFLRINERLNMEVQEELLELMQIKSLKSEKARILYNAGITDPETVHHTSADKLLKIIQEGECFMSKKSNFDRENQYRRKYIETIVSAIKKESMLLVKDFSKKEDLSSSSRSASSAENTYLEIISDEDDLADIDEDDLEELEAQINQEDILDLI
ncbi:unnamed protein product [Moneuplotes crassus]|uniref:Uncharacterized protein n=1 Tax=Euplotes crassus TaxID=5936 RepID=A0AAD1UNW1_EUPCR|nr:unnamed protein product [Moneuplotes crassus]